MTDEYLWPARHVGEYAYCPSLFYLMGDETLLGAVPMEDMDVLIHPAKRQLVINPDSPTMPVAPVKKILY